MTGKRKRTDNATKEPPGSDALNNTAKPLSAIAAARLKAATAHVLKNDGFQEPPASPLAEASPSEAAEIDLEDIPPILQNLKLSNWRDHGSNVLSDTARELTILMEKHETVSFVGCFDVKVLKGAVNINGANLAAAPRQQTTRTHRVYVPSTHPITKIRGLDRTNQVQFSSCPEPTPFAEISPLFSGIWSGNENPEKGRSFAQVSESDDDSLKRLLVPEQAPEDWLRTIEEITTSASPRTDAGPSHAYRTLVLGSQSSGKSTFAKRLLNRYLTGMGKMAKAIPAVCFLDLDPSKPEYTPHGQISLTIVRELSLGPAYTYVPQMKGDRTGNETIVAHVLPVQGLDNYEDYFIACAERLIQTYLNIRLDGILPPLIVNTPSSLYTSYFPTLLRLLNPTKPDSIIHLSDTPSPTEETAAKLHDLQTHAPKTKSSLHELTAQTPSVPPSRTDAELRAMQMQAYFHSDSKPSSSTEGPRNQTYTTHPLTHTTPWEFGYLDTEAHTQDVLAILPLSEPLDPSHLLTALNGTLIHIVSTTDAELLASSSADIARTPATQIPFFTPDPATRMVAPPAPHATSYVCTALLRGIDPSARVLQLLVPAAAEATLGALDGATTVFVAGCCDTPEWAYVEEAYGQLAVRRRELARDGRAEGVGDEVVMEGVEMAPWVVRKREVDAMGYMNIVRRVRKFLM